MPVDVRNLLKSGLPQPRMMGPNSAADRTERMLLDAGLPRASILGHNSAADRVERMLLDAGLPRASILGHNSSADRTERMLMDAGLSPARIMGHNSSADRTERMLSQQAPTMFGRTPSAPEHHSYSNTQFPTGYPANPNVCSTCFNPGYLHPVSFGGTYCYGNFQYR